MSGDVPEPVPSADASAPVATEPVEVTRRLPMAAARAWGFVTSPVVQAAFLGQGSSLPPREGGSVHLARAMVGWRNGTVEAVTGRSELVVLSLIHI